MIRLLFCYFFFICGLVATEGIHFFETKVKPVFEQHCNKCHNEKKAKGGLRLDIPEGILLGSDSGEIIDHKDIDESILLIAVKRLDEDIEMPPKNSLPQKDIATLEQWIKMGAPLPKSKDKVSLKKGYEWDEELKHWAYIAPQKAHGKNNIDEFVNESLQKHELKANARASKVELIRRATFDLIGLPPSPEETDDFLSDTSSQAFEKVLERLLSSPHYGERWARHWLDVARYGDDQPYAFQQKKLSSAWKYRDWLVTALNKDLPYTEFIRRQLAADLITNLDPEEHAATGLISTGPMYFKRTEVQKALADELDDRVDVVSKAFLGLTVSCARCHDHKFDAIPTKDYYSLAGVFKSTRIYDRFVASDDEINEYYRRAMQQGNIKRKLKDIVLKYSTMPSAKPLDFENSIEIDDLQAMKIGSWKSSRHYKGFSGKSYLHDGNQAKGKSSISFPLEIKEAASYELFMSYSSGEDRAKNIPVEIHHAEGLSKVSVNQTLEPVYKGKYTSLGHYNLSPSTKGKVVISNKGTKRTVIADSILIIPHHKESKHLVQQKISDYSGPEPIFSTETITMKSRDHRGLVDVDISGLEEFYLVSEYDAVKKYEFHFHSWMNPVLKRGTDSLKMTELEPESYSSDNKFYGAKFDSNEDAIICNGEVINHGFHCSGTTVLKFKVPAGAWQRFRAETGVFTKNAGTEINNRVRFHIFKEDPSEWLKKQGKFKNLDESSYFNADTSHMSDADASEYAKLKKLLEAEKAITPQLVHSLWEGDIRDMKINIRGNPKKFGEKAPRGYLSILNNGKALDFKKGSGRLGLADLIANKKNPLTARVMVNRMWHKLFGKGIVTSPSNFGKLGDPPSNQQLLDYLAVDFMEKNWSIKEMLKTMMLSEVYQRSSRFNQQNAEIDGDNQFLWRQNMKRLDAEAMRDSILKVAGKLNDSLGGSSSNITYGSDFNRRMIYAKVSRTAPDSMRATFDFPSAVTSSPKRNLTTVPQQKLFTLIVAS